MQLAGELRRILRHDTLREQSLVKKDACSISHKCIIL